MKKLLLLTTCILLLQHFLHAQEYSYTRYDVQHGLAGSTVYCMLQDKDGFLWFGTETGVSRFDGTHFRNFTTSHGLPDNQVLEIFEDSKGRIWMGPFGKSVCYYYKGKIYNQDNDTVLSKVKPSGYIINFAEDSSGNILLQQSAQLHLIKPSGRVILLKPAAALDSPFISSGTNPQGRFEVLAGQTLLEIRNDQPVLKETVRFPYPNYRYALMERGIFLYRNQIEGFVYRHNGKEIQLKYGLDASFKFSIISDSLISVNTPSGAWLHNVQSGSEGRMLPNEPVSTVYQDREGNMWLCTMGHGVFMLNSPHILNFSLRHENGAKLGAYVLARYRDGWLAGADMIRIFKINRSAVQQVHTFLDYMPERVTSIEIGADSIIWAGTDSRMIMMDKELNVLHRDFFETPIKAFHKVNNRLYIATARAGFIFDIASRKVIDTFWHDRSTTVFTCCDKIYIGTLDGLFVRNKDRSLTDLGQQFPQLRHRIMDIRQSADGTVWIATFSGIFALRDDKIISGFTEEQGLVSNICRTINIYKNELWAGTNKGLQKIDISDPLHPKPEYVLSSELSSNIINYIVADSTTVAVATAEGVNIIDKSRISFFSITNLHMDNVIVSGKSMQWQGRPLFLSQRDNNIRFEFAGISFTSAGDMRYEYRLLGLDSGWKQTRDNFLSYPTLPGGQYQLQLVAINKFGLKSNLLRLDFTIEKKLWQKTWFQLLSGLTILFVVWLILSWRIKVIRRQEEEKVSIQKKMASLEQLALKSQMNPHFIFNSLNSIQHYVFDKDVSGANRFITGFSRLIRQTLDISSKHEISISEEINYLSTYLLLEKMRFEDKFSFVIRVDPDLQPDESFIPPLILQPFVENCVRHGIRYRQDNEGKITIEFKKSGTRLECIIEDNGIGRKMAQLHKSNNPIEYQSKGISLTADRIALMNRTAARPITIDIVDLENEMGGSTGTKVVISFPLQLN
ncbi:MAG TPA: two-component regulator propeller domain-containing protein [Chitinophagaceae bacterium]|nr:two-component regulator propeller domain-containing protein [Chitinophagaceae bacterium]